ncbi:MAG: RNA-processing protein [Thermoprotei archaeon]|nr:MAG: RNA-processing protein [Thermoprotei archaeon]
MNKILRLEIPVEPKRIGYIIGKNGKNKQLLEKTFNIKIDVNSKDSTVILNILENMRPIDVMKIKQAIKALSIGFKIDDVLKMKEDIYQLEVIDLREVSRNWKDMQRIKGRIIGENGKTKKILEEMTGATIIIGEREVGILGDYEQIRIAREAIRLIIAGRSHKTVYDYLRIQKRELKKRRMELWERWTL